MTKIYPRLVEQNTHQVMLPQIHGGPTDLCRRIMRLIGDLFNAIISPFFSFTSSSRTTTVTTRVATPARVPTPNELFLDFYKGMGKNSGGRTFAEMMNWDDYRLESDRSSIEWLFPTLVSSKQNLSAPVLTTKSLEAFKLNPIYADNMRLAFKRMIRFYGLQWSDQKTLERAPNFALRSCVWLTPNNHNFSRITQMLISLNALGFDHELEEFMRVLTSINAREGNGIISDKAFQTWRRSSF